MSHNTLIPHLFRTEFSKIIAVICKSYGLQNIQAAEDIVSETFLAASETWGLKGTPDNPQAWLYQVAKNKTKDYLKRKILFREKITPNLSHNDSQNPVDDINLSENNITDSQLQMLFAVSNPILPPEAQTALALRVLCGFGINEIALAFLSNKQSINKRLLRAKQKLRDNKVEMVMPDKNELANRLSSVLATIYLLFNEGYYSTTSEVKIKRDLCFEAMRLLVLLLNYPPANLPKCNALMALMCFQASRFDARLDESGEIILYENQNREKWDFELIEQGEYYMNQSANGDVISKYHLQAAIAFWHTRVEDETGKWENILQLYNQLLQIQYSPIAALNRTFALSKVKGKKQAIKEALKIDLKDYHLYQSLLAELYTDLDKKKAKQHWQMAFDLANTEGERKVIKKKIMACG